VLGDVEVMQNDMYVVSGFLLGAGALHTQEAAWPQLLLPHWIPDMGRATEGMDKALVATLPS